MKIRLIALFMFIFCNSAIAAQSVYTATPKDNNFKFVFSGLDGVYTSYVDKTSLRCSFKKHLEGLDNAGEPYSAIIFVCPKGMTMSLKYYKKTQRSYFIASSSSMEGTGSEEVFVKEESY